MNEPTLFHLLRFRGKLFALTLAAWIVYSCYPLATGLITRAIFESLAGESLLQLSIWALIGLLVLVEVGARLLLLAWFLLHQTFEPTLMALVSTNIFRWTMNHAGVHSLPAAPGEALSRFRDDIDPAVSPINEWYRLIGEGIFAIIALVIMARIDLFITVAGVIPLACITIVVHRMRTRLETYRRAAQESTSQATGFITELFGAVQAVKVAGAEDTVTTRFAQLNERRRVAAVKDIAFNTLLNSFSWNPATLSRGVILLLGAEAIRRGTFTIGDFALFVTYMEWIMELPRRVGRLLASRRLARVSTQRLLALLPGESERTLIKHSPVYLDQPPPIADRAPAVKCAALDLLEAEGLTYRYPATGRGIECVSLRLRRGTITVITGRIGAGKTTLLRVLLGLAPLDAGTIRWNGERVDQPAAFFVPPRVAYTPQTPRLFSESVRDNILQGLAAEEETLQRALRDAVLEPDIARLEQQLDTLVGPRGVRLSGGQIQRVAAARMFIREPELLVFDDLSSALDGETERLLWANLSAREAPTALVASHRRVAFQRADHIILLRDGRVAAEGALATLLHSSVELREIWAEQEA
jgi:ATP-binding cassette subfamily B protein